VGDTEDELASTDVLGTEGLLLLGNALLSLLGSLERNFKKQRMRWPERFYKDGGRKVCFVRLGRKGLLRSSHHYIIRLLLDRNGWRPQVRLGGNGGRRNLERKSPKKSSAALRGFCSECGVDLILVPSISP